MATVAIPSSRHALAILEAISPRLAIRTFLNTLESSSEKVKAGH
jgi:hypothetical protein